MDRTTFLVILATAVVTNLVGAASVWWTHRLQSRRDSAARQEQEQQQQRAERRTLQRSTLLRLQEILVEIAWSSVRPQSLDAATYGYGRRSFDDVVGAGWSDKLATLAGELAMIRARLTDDDLRNRLNSIRSQIVFVIDVADNAVDGGEALMLLNKDSLDALDRVGEFLAGEWSSSHTTGSGAPGHTTDDPRVSNL